MPASGRMAQAPYAGTNNKNTESFTNAPNTVALLLSTTHAVVPWAPSRRMMKSTARVPASLYAYPSARSAARHAARPQEQALGAVGAPPQT